MFDSNLIPRSNNPGNSPRQLLPLLAAAVLSVSTIALVIFLIRLSQSFSTPEETVIELRQIELSLPPPPPPPPPQQQARTPQNLSLDLPPESSGPALEVARVELDDSLDLIEPPPPLQAQNMVEWNRDLSIDWSAFSLDQLDSLPQIVSLQKVTFPPELARRNIDRVMLQLDVFIDETGRVTLINVVENPYPEILDRAIQRIVQTARFTAPSRNGEPVRARFVWPVEIVQ